MIRIRNRSLAGACAALLALALAGCSKAPSYVRPAVPVNEDWIVRDAHLAAQAPIDTLWWRAFGDPTLDSLVEMAYHQNLPLRIAGLRILEARAQLGIALGNRWPQIQAAVGSATAYQVSEHAPNAFGIDHNYWDYQVGFDAVWELDFWKKYGNEAKAEAATYWATIADYDQALVTLTAEVARTYAVVRTFEVLIQQARDNVTIQEEGLRISQSRFRNGATSELDVAQATTLLEGTRASIPTLEGGLQQSQNALSTLLGQAPGTVQAILDSGRKGIPVTPPSVALSVPAELLRRRPDVRSAELQAMGQSSRIGVAKADLYPRFTLFGSIGTETSSGGGIRSNNSTFSNIFGAGSWFYSFGPRIFWPIFNYGRIKNNIRVQDARLEQLLVNYQDVVLRAAQEVEDGLAGYTKAQESAVFGENAVQGAQRAVDIALLQYREGAVDYQRVLDAQRSLLTEQNSLTRTNSSIATNLISVYKALGGGWELRQGQPFVPDSTRIEMERRTNWGDMIQEPPATHVSDSSKSN